MGETSDYTDLDLYNQSPATVGKQNQIINALNSSSGGISPTDMLSAVLDAGAGATTEVIVGVPGSEIWVYGWYAGASVASGSYVWKSDGTAKTGTIPVGINGGGVMTSTFPIFKCAVGDSLNITTIASAIDGIVQYILV